MRSKSSSEFKKNRCLNAKMTLKNRCLPLKIDFNDNQSSARSSVTGQPSVSGQPSSESEYTDAVVPAGLKPSPPLPRDLPLLLSLPGPALLTIDFLNEQNRSFAFINRL